MDGRLAFVRGENVVAEGLAFGVEDAGAVLGRVIAVEPTQHVEHAIHGAGRLARGIAQIGHGVKGAVEIAGSIDKQQGGHAFDSLWFFRGRRVNASAPFA